MSWLTFLGLQLVTVCCGLSTLMLPSAARRVDRWFRRTYPQTLSGRSRRGLDPLVDELTALGRELHWANRNPTEEAGRLRELTIRYDRTLRECCAVLKMDLPGDPPMTPFERIQTEAELCRRGIDW